MFHWFGVVQNTRGDALPGWQIGLVQVGTETVVPIFSDENSTPIINVSGVANRAVADDNGNYDFFVPSGTYTLQFYNPSGVFQRQQRFVAMFGADAANTANLASNDAGKGASLVATEGSGTVQTALNARPTSAALAASGGAALVGVIQSGAGATARTVQAKLRETVSVKDFGAVADGTTNDAPAFSAALDYLISIGGGSLKVPSGTYRLTSRLSKTLNAAQCITIKGDGRQNSVLDFSGAASLGIQFISSSTTANRKPEIEICDLSITTSRDNAGDAVHVTYANDLNFLPSVTIRNVYIGGTITRGSDSGSGFGYWSRGVYLLNARNSRLRNVQFIGEISKSPRTVAAVYLDGESTATQLENCLLMEGDTGVYATGTTEGVSVINCDVLYFRYGIYHDTVGEPQLTVIGGSVNCSEVGVWMDNSLQSVVMGVLFYAAFELDTPGPYPEWRGVLVTGANSRHNKILGCTFTKNDNRTGDITTGIDFAAGSFLVASGNTFEGFSGNQLTFGVQVRSGVDQAHIADDNRFANVSSPTIIDPAATRSFGPALRQAGLTGAVTTGTTITFPQAFPSACDAVFLTHAGTNTGTIVTASSVSATGFTLNHNTGGSATFYWHAVGR